jgi:hypothetical protein
MTTVAKPAIRLKDLRIGNWIGRNPVDLGHSGKRVIRSPFKILEVRENGVVSYLTDDVCQTVSLDDCYPILLTPELLEKCGFVLKTFEERGHKHNLYFVPNHVNEMAWLVRIKHGTYQNINRFCLADTTEMRSQSFYYLHQIQNIFYCLTGSELEVNL